MNIEIRTGETARRLEADLRSRIESGKISQKAIKDFLKKYYEGDPACNGCPTGCKEPVECYIQIHLALIDDDGELHDFGESYIRDGEPFCCGKTLDRLDHAQYCSICGNEYGE